MIEHLIERGLDDLDQALAEADAQDASEAAQAPAASPARQRRPRARARGAEPVTEPMASAEPVTALPMPDRSTTPTNGASDDLIDLIAGLDA